MLQEKESTEQQSPQDVYYPSFLLLEMVMGLAVFILVAVILAGFFPVGLEDPADPTDNLYVPKPEWYFVFLYQLLKYFPGRLEAVATFVVTAGGFLVLLLLPFIDKNAEKRPRKRPIAVTALIITVLAILVLTLIGL